MPVVHIHQTSKTSEQKRELVKSITEAFGSTLGYPASTITIVIHEMPADGIATGGVLLADR